MKRGVCSLTFTATVLLMLGIEILSCGQPLFNAWFSVTEIVDILFAGSGCSELLLCLLPLFPCALTYARDEQEKNTGFWIVRAGVSHYMWANYITACLSALLCVALSMWLLVLFLLCGGHPFYRELPYQAAGYAALLSEQKPVPYLLMYIFDRGMSAMMMAGCAVWVSTLYPNPFAAFVTPVCLNFMALRLDFIPSGDAYVKYQFFRVSNWIEGTYDAPGGPGASLLAKVLVTAAVCLVFGILAAHNTRKRWHYA